MTALRDKLIAAFSEIYWKPNNKRSQPMTHEMADAALKLFNDKSGANPPK